MSFCLNILGVCEIIFTFTLFGSCILSFNKNNTYLLFDMIFRRHIGSGVTSFYSKQV